MKSLRSMVLWSASLTVAALLLWRFIVVSEQSERSVHWAANPTLNREPDKAVYLRQDEEIERLVFQLTNRERRRRGLSSLEREETLAEISRRHSSDMLDRGYFDHVSPEGRSAQQRIAARHRRLIGLVGENIWSGSGYDTSDREKLARAIVGDWLDSPGHRENILRPDYTHLGVGIVVAGRDLLATQNFAMVRAYLKEALPERVRRDAPLDLRVTPYGEMASPAELFTLWSGDQQREETEPLPVAGARVRARPGTYQLRLYFPEASTGSYTIYFGPRIEVE